MPKPRKTQLRAVSVSIKNQSMLTTRATIVQGVDGRSPEGRRIRDLVVAFSEQTFGCPFEALAEVDAVLVKHAAVSTWRAELMQAAIVRGEAVCSDDFVRESNMLTRAMAALQKRKKPAKQPTLAERLRAAREG